MCSGQKGLYSYKVGTQYSVIHFIDPVNYLISVNGWLQPFI